MKCEERWLTVVLMTAAVGCGDGDSASKAETPAAVAQAKATYSIKAYAKVGDSVELVEFSPEKRGVMDAETAEDSASPEQSAMNSASAAMAVYDRGDETYETSLEEEGADSALGQLALYECFNPPAIDYVRDSDTALWLLIGYPWGVSGVGGHRFWYYFHAGQIAGADFAFFTCDELLYAQDLLLCAAGKLNEIAEAVAPVEFTQSGYPLVFPPQATRDRFVARDMALNMLAHLGRIEGEWVASANPGESPTCTERWEQIAQGESNNWDSVFSVVDETVPYLALDGNTELPTDLTAPGLAAKRLGYHAHILRSAGRMVRDIVVKSVAEDAAGAEKQRADAGDPALGLRRMWGVSRELNAGYSSFSHGLQTLFGRLELGLSAGPFVDVPTPGAPSANDPRCGGYFSFYSLVTPPEYTPAEEEGEQVPVTNEYSLVHAMSASADVLWDELPPASADQASAVNVLEAAGIIFPKTTLDSWSDHPELVDAVREQLVLNAALAQSDSESGLDDEALLDAYEQTALGEAARAVADSMQSEDMLFGLERNLHTVQLAFDLKPNDTLQAIEHRLDEAEVSLRAPGAGDDNGVTPGLESGALVAMGGLSVLRRDLAVPGAVRSLGPRAATQCPMEPMWTTAPGARLHPQLMSFQSPMGLARVLMDSLTSSRKRMEEAADRAAVAEALDVTTKAVAEMASWGPRVQTTLTLPDSSAGARVEILGIVPSDFGAATPDELAERLVLAVGTGWEAQCLAGTRAACPSAAGLASSVLDTDITWSDSPSEASDGLLFELSTSLRPAKAASWGMRLADGRRYYVIVKGADGEVGRVIAVLEPRPGMVVDFHSPLRDDLADQLFSTKASSAIPKMCRESNAAGISSNYCVPGVPRDFFVPLANELTSEFNGTVEDSWKHYLTLAEQAAARTDELGQEIIETGLQRDFRREAAQEELAEICGSFTAAEGIGVTNGRVDTTDSDSEINQCLQADTYDVVFLGANRFGESSTATEVQAAYCQGTQRPKFCDKPPEELKIAFLGLPSVTDGEPNVASVCSQVAEAHSALEGNQSAWNDGILTEAMNDGEISPEALQLSAMQLHLVVDQDPNRWSLQTGVQVLMERKPDSEVAALDPSLGSEAAGVRVYPLCKQLDPDAWDCDPLDYFEADGTEHDGADARPPCCDGLAATFDRAFGTQGDSIPSALLTSLGHRIESAVWHLGALAGSLPAEAITMPVPVANFSEAGASGPLPDAWAPTLYATGRFTGPSGGEYNIDAGSSPEVTTIDTRYLTHLLPMNSDYAASRQDLGPDWSREVFAAATAADGRYLVVPDAASPEIRFNTNMLNGDGDRVSRESMTNWIASTIAALGGDTTSSSTGQSNALRAMQTLSGLDPGDESAAESWRHVCTPGATGFIRDNRYGGYPDVNASTELVLIDKWTVGEGRRPFSAYFPDGDDKKTRAVLSSGRSEGSLVIGPAGCTVVNEPRVTAGCALATGSYLQPFMRVRFYAPRVLSAQHCPPGDRVELFVHRSIEDEAQARQALVDAFLLGCTARQNTSVGRVHDLPHAIQTEQDLEYFEGWLSAVALEANALAEQLFVEDVPQVVVADFQQGLVGTDAVGNGTLGQHQLEMGTGFRGINTGWNHMASSLRQLRNAVQLLRLELAGIRLQGERDELQLAFQKTEQWRQLTVGAIQAAAGTLGAVCAPTSADMIGSIGDAAVGAANVAFSMAQLENLDEQEQVAHEQTQNSVNQAIQSFNQQVEGLNLAYQDAVTVMQDAQAQVLSALNSDRSARNEAAFEAAKASGADFANVDDEVVALPVNTVLRRQYDILQRRYERSLTNAKYLAYMARLAIEQRIGVRMNDLNVEVGALEAPSLWADDVCSLQGIDYDALRQREEDSTDGQEEIQIDEFVDAYIGDYVEKLRQFVEYYNIDAPFQQADDLVVVSLRDDVLGSAGQCERESRNLLFFSDQLWHGASEAAEDSDAPQDVSLGGWRRAECGLDDTVCLDVTLPEVNESDEWRVTDMEPPGGIGAVSWLRDRDAEEVRSADQEILETEGASEATDTNGPGRAVYQSVSLRTATDYQLSWWDRALDPANGSAEVSDGEPYQVSVYASDWTVVASATFEPANQDTVTEDGWSERRSMLFTAIEDGTYHVVFRPSAPGATTGSVAIADVQLAELESADMTVAYESTNASRMVVSGGCGKGNPDMMRSAFEYRCEDGRCFYEMKNAFDLGIIAQGSSSPIANRVAVGNFNYRNVSTALNIVGTGVLDCSDGTESCYGNGQVQYDLEHSAHSVGLEDYAGDSWCFNFERAGIRGAKALATERYLTVPMSSADQALIGDEAFSKRELFGRPLSGQYKLRLYDTSSLQWDRVEDIQIAVRYRYWSRVDRAM